LAKKLLKKSFRLFDDRGDMVLGQDTERILSWLGYGRDEIDSFRKEGII